MLYVNYDVLLKYLELKLMVRDQLFFEYIRECEQLIFSMKMKLIYFVIYCKISYLLLLRQYFYSQKCF